MHSVTELLTSPSSPRAPGFFARLLRALTGRERVEDRPAMRWASDVKPIDWEGEDTSLTQAHLEVLR